MKYIKLLSEISMKDVALFGGKNAALGEMIQHIEAAGITVPRGFAISSSAYFDHIKRYEIDKEIRDLFQNKKMQDVQKISQVLRKKIESIEFSDELKHEIAEFYKQLSDFHGQKQSAVAVRSSAIAEDSPGVSFAGQHETFLAIQGIESLLESVKKSMSSLFTPRAIVYRQKRGFSPLDVGMSVGVQKMVMAGRTISGVGFSIDTETGFDQVIMIESAYGFGETIVQGAVIPDLFVFHKTLLDTAKDALIKKQLGRKEKKMILKAGKLRYIKTTQKERSSFSLSEQEGKQLAQMILAIEDYYSKKYKKYMPMDIEWAKNEKDKKMYIIQAQPETVSQNVSQEEKKALSHYVIQNKPKPLLIGQSIGSQVVHGIVFFVHDILQAKKRKTDKENAILVTDMTSPDLLLLMKQVVGIITEQGGRTCHAAIVSRELGMSAIVGASDARKILKEGQKITIDCSQGNEGYIYSGFVPFVKKKYNIIKQQPPVPVLVNMAHPDSAFMAAQLPVSGVGLLRMEFIIAQAIGIHPMACVQYDTLDKTMQKKIKERIGAEYKNTKEFFVSTLSRSLSLIVAAFLPRPVTIRFSDFKTNEYRELLGGHLFEPEEENPMIGFRGAIRYLDKDFEKAFFLELDAISYLVTDMNLTNIKLLVPFVRSVTEAEQVIQMIKKQKVLSKLPIYMMIEIPENLFSIKDYAQLFDGFSIGSNDLFQLFFGVDRDSATLAKQYTEINPLFLHQLTMLLQETKKYKKPISICGQAPSDFPDIADLLIKNGITEISLNIDAVIPFLARYQKK
jgi:pyruvate, water dikinase